MTDYKFGVNEPPHKRWPVAWYNPSVLKRAINEMISSTDQLRNLDRRELFTEKFVVIDASESIGQQDYWWDFMSDSGDGGNASYSVARAMQSPAIPSIAASNLPTNITLPAELPRGKLLVLGGDLAYPGASTEEYQYRFIEMWEAARPQPAAPVETKTGSANTTPATQTYSTVVAIPQNHDWFDNISTFNRQFIGSYGNSFLNANAPQKQSYFATKLPHGWWILGLDFALLGDLDRKQYEVFFQLFDTKASDANPKIHKNDNVILLYPEPYWTRPVGDAARIGYPKRYQRLEAELAAHGINVRIRLAGDLHHYVRETAASDDKQPYNDMLITCGTGGAFLHPTHSKRTTCLKIMDCAQDEDAMTGNLKNRVCVGISSNPTATPEQRAYGQQVCYPDQETSKGLTIKNLWALFLPPPHKGLFSSPTHPNIMKRTTQRMAELCNWFFAGNIMFPITVSILYCMAVYCVGFVFSESFIPDNFVPSHEIGSLTLWCFLKLWFRALFFSPLALAAHILLCGLCFAVVLEDGSKTKFIGALLSILNIFAGATLYWLISKITPNPWLKGFLLLFITVFSSGILFGAFFFITSRLGYLTNNAFSPLGHQGYKGFLRFKIDTNGDLHGYMIGTDSVPTSWKKSGADDTHRPLWTEENKAEAPQWKVRDAFVLKK